jgi:hypothetical protein
METGYPADKFDALNIFTVNCQTVLKPPEMLHMLYTGSGPGSSVGIATGYGLDSAGIKSRWGEIFCTRPDQPLGPPSLLYNGCWVFPG